MILILLLNGTSSNPYAYGSVLRIIGCKEKSGGDRERRKEMKEAKIFCIANSVCIVRGRGFPSHSSFPFCQLDLAKKLD